MYELDKYTKPVNPDETVDERRVNLYPDGVYRWIGELNLYKNPTILFMLWKIFFFICIGIFVFTSLFDMGNRDFFWKGFLENLKFWGLITGGFLVLVLIGYLVYAMIMKGRYTVVFEMGKNGFSHRQIAAQADKAQAISMLTTLAGLLAKNPTTMGVGLNAARTEMTTDFSKVKSIQGFPRRGVIKVNETLEKNQIYVLPEDYDFVWNFVKENCPQAKIK
ncbi:MAG: hypothetical protein J5493_01200 [Lachnospiraceae bacterium]|nr:hypothetical protein [Lachnospiraceae bacterium]